MTLTPEQFNQLVTKNDFNELKDEVLEIEAGVNTLLTAVDGLAKNLDDQHSEFAANLAAHDRFENRLKCLEQTAQA